MRRPAVVQVNVAPCYSVASTGSEEVSSCCDDRRTSGALNN